ncbi:hypothetical protein L1987_54617 [Smallanthus sonchifolius]|uniref:Uncharacterized protein n=1 Tax=Smallanthus sonchifolius TaxID=185202 RepID=A0ACB9E8Q0_9ASTR|nr:hypothetical protein L1987_54617 [Smallanthus sonchifolius]
MDRRVEYKHNQVALLDPELAEAANYQEIINFLNRSRIHVALSANPHISLLYIQHLWETAQQDTNVEPRVIRATVNNQDIVVFKGWGYRGRPNDSQARKGGLVGQWRYFMYVIIQCLSPRKAGTDGLKTSLQAAMVALTLNRPFNFALYIYRELVMQITPPEGQGFLMYPRFLQVGDDENDNDDGDDNNDGDDDDNDDNDDDNAGGGNDGDNVQVNADENEPHGENVEVEETSSSSSGSGEADDNEESS